MINEANVERQCMSWFEALGYTAIPNKAVHHDDEHHANLYSTQAILRDVLYTSLERLNPTLTTQAVQEAYNKLLDLSDISDIIARNRASHEYMTTGVKVNNLVEDEERGDIARVIDIEHPFNNDFRVITQVRIQGMFEKRRPDIIVYVNGLPVAVLELKNPTDERADLEKAYNQIQTYKAQIPDIFTFNVVNIISDGFYTGCGSITADFIRFAPWKQATQDGTKNLHEWELQTLINGLFRKDLWIDYIKYFVIFEEQTSGVYTKKIASYHQFYGVRKAVDASVIAHEKNTKKCGVFWHTQGSGKSISMVCYVAKLRQHPKMNNPTFVVVTDRKDLDSQLYETFCLSQRLVGAVQQAKNRAEVRDYLNRRLSGGVLFTTIQKFALEDEEERFPVLNTRDNIIVITDEAHRSQYGHRMKLNKDNKYTYGMSKHMRDALPNAGFIGFTGTPIDVTDKSTREVFGGYVDIYDITNAVHDGVTVDIYYEGRMIPLKTNEDLSAIDNLIEDADMSEKEKAKWAGVASVAGAPERVDTLAKDFIKHFNKRQTELKGKAMIVTMSRENCVLLYNTIITLNPDWHHNDIDKGTVKIVMSATADDSDILKDHKYTSESIKRLERRFKNPHDSLKIVIVRDMWLTGFDVPCLNTLYIDKPMQGHSLMQAIARVNRVFENKVSGLVVDYIGLAQKLREATNTYTKEGGQGHATIDVKEAVKICVDMVDVCREILKDIDYKNFATEPMAMMRAVCEYITDVRYNDEKKRFCDAVVALLKAYTLCGTDPRIETIIKEITFYRGVKAIIMKGDQQNNITKSDTDAFMRDILADAIKSVDGTVLSLSAVAGFGERQQISILDDAFLSQIRNSSSPNLALELLRRLLQQEIKARFKTNIVQQKAFSERLTETIRRMNEQAISTTEAIEQLIAIGKDIVAEEKREIDLHLSKEEYALYSAVCQNKAAVEHIEEKMLVELAKKIRKEIEKSITVDWTKRENIKADMRVDIRQLLKAYKYPSDKHPSNKYPPNKYPPNTLEKTIDIILQQAQSLDETWVR